MVCGPPGKSERGGRGKWSRAGEVSRGKESVPDESAKKERGKSGEGSGNMRVRREEAGTTGWEKGKEREEEARWGRVGREEEREGERPKR